MIVNTPVGRRDIPDDVASRSGLLAPFVQGAKSQEVNLQGRFLETDGIVDRVIIYLESNSIPRGPENDILIFNMILAAEYFQIPDLMNFYIAKIRNVIASSHSAAEVRGKFQLDEDLSAAEQASAAKENPWEDFDLVEAYNSSRDMSVSMIVDGESRFRTVTADPMYGIGGNKDDIGYDIVKYVQPRRPITPIPDEHAPTCSGCKTYFSTIIRRHHCRRCGRVYCYSCSSKYAHLPDNMNVYQGYSSAYTRVKTWVGSWAAEANKVQPLQQRVCDSCYEAVTEQENLWIYIQAFHVIAFELPLLKRAATVCKNWRRAAILCLSSLRELQYLLPTGTLNDNEKRMLWNNRAIWAGHSQWIIAMLKAVNWKDPDASQQAIAVLKTPDRKYSCWQTMCSRNCEKCLTPADALWLLGEDMHTDLRVYAVHCLRGASKIELLCYLPVLVHDLRYGNPGPLAEFLLDQALGDAQFCNDMYWGLATCAESKKYKRLYDSVLHKLLVVLSATKGEATARQLITGQDLISFLERIPVAATPQELQSLFANELESTYTAPLALPVNATIETRTFRAEGVKVKQSKTAPIEIPCKTRSPRPDIYSVSATHPVNDEEYEYKFMFKREDVRKDQIVLNVIKLMDTIIKKELGFDLKVLTYRVVPTSSNDGLIEMVPNSKTLFEILKSGKIHQHLVNFNGQVQVDNLLTTYMRSLAAWTVITYLLGVGDRHMDNIMITHSGILFHIDYGFVLGKDPKPLAPYIRMNESMIEGMGGRDSSHYTDFKELCADVFLVLRRHISLFFNLLLVMAKADPPVTDLIFDAKYLEEQLSKRFLPGQTESEARTTIQLLVQNTDTIVQWCTDFIHQHSRENTISEGVKTISNASGYMVKATSQYFTYWGSKK